MVYDCVNTNRKLETEQEDMFSKKMYTIINNKNAKGLSQFHKVHGDRTQNVLTEKNMTFAKLEQANSILQI